MQDSLWKWLLSTVLELEVIGLLVMGTMGKLLVSTRPIRVRVIIGEILFSIVAGVLLSTFADTQEWSAARTISTGCIVSLVGIDVLVAYLKKRFFKRI